MNREPNQSEVDIFAYVEQRLAVDQLWPGNTGPGSQYWLVNRRFGNRKSSPADGGSDLRGAVTACGHILPACTADHPSAIVRIAEERSSRSNVLALGGGSTHAAEYDVDPAGQRRDRALRSGSGMDDPRVRNFSGEKLNHASEKFLTFLI